MVFSFSAICGAESGDPAVVQVGMGDDITVFCISTETIFGVAVEGRRYIQHIAEHDRIGEVLSTLLDKDGYEAFLNEYESAGYAEAEAYTPTLETVLNWDYGNWITERRIGDDWILAYCSLVDNTDMFTSLTVKKFILKYEHEVI